MYVFMYVCMGILQQYQKKEHHTLKEPQRISLTPINRKRSRAKELKRRTSYGIACGAAWRS